MSITAQNNRGIDSTLRILADPDITDANFAKVFRGGVADVKHCLISVEAAMARVMTQMEDEILLVVGQMARRGFNIDARFYDSMTSLTTERPLLHSAIIEDRVKIVSALLALGANPYQREIITFPNRRREDGRNSFELAEEGPASSSAVAVRDVLNSWRSRELVDSILAEPGARSRGP